jgi:UDP-N-acetylmuramoylalanine--D-glutamate ligase
MLIVLGGGESGIGTALLAKKQGLNVFVSDKGDIAEKQALKDNNIPFEEGGHSIDILVKATEVVKSPGIAPDTPVIQLCHTRNIPILSEIAWASRYYTGTIIGVTGTNGKSTTTNLIHHLLTEAGLDAAKGGNLGESFARMLTKGHPDIAVLEMSSFQLEDIGDMRPHISLWLNLTPDHLDRYDFDVKKYAAAKWRITENQTDNDWFIYDGSDSHIRALVESEPRPVQKIGINPDAYGPGWLEIAKGQRWTLDNPMLVGRHNAFNASCAAKAAMLMGVDAATIQKGLSSFVNDPHRMEPVAVIDGVSYINDSKATNVDAVLYALEGVKSPVVWIAGGTDKGNNYEQLMPLVKEKVAALICLGVDNERLKEAFGGVVEVLNETRSMAEAIRMAKDQADEGSTVLLSPACASFDLFKNYMDRGDQFREEVRKMGSVGAGGG